MIDSTSEALYRALRGPLSQSFIELKASRIADPVERLRYLRRAARLAPEREWRGTRMFWAAAPVLLLAFAAAWITPSKAGLRLKSLPSVAGWFTPASATVPRLKSLPTLATRAEPPSKVWLVDQNRDAEVFSNGLRVERRYATESDPRSYQAFPRSGAPPVRQSAPVGIVFHASESDMAPFEPDHAQAVKRQALGLLDWVRSNKLYNYVVDRTGRVYRIVKEDERADHAGNSVWADGNWIYVNLNNSFLGVAFEARTGTPLEPAQVHSGRILVDMLRSRYGIPAENCVTHAQVSVNPSNFRVGYHTDWVANFPFRDLGLTDNYARPLASLYLFGFSYDPGYLESAAIPLRESLLRCVQEMQHEAEQKDLPFALHQRNLRARYKQLRAVVVPPDQESSYGN